MANGRRSGCAGCITAFIIILVLVLATALALFFLVRDTSPIMTEDATKDTRSTEQIVKSLMGSALLETEDAAEIDATFSEADLNAILAGIVRSNKVKGLEGLAINFIDDNSLSFKASFKFSIFQALINADIGFSESEDGKTLTFTFKSIKAGKIPMSDTIIKWVGQLAKLDQTIANISVGGTKLNAKLEYSPLRVSVAKETILNLVLNQATSESNNVATSLLSWAVSDNDLGKLSFGKNGVGIKINLTELAYSQVRDGDMSTSINVDQIDTKLETLLNNGAIDCSQIDVSANFIIKGYDKLSSSEKDAISEIDYSSIGINNKQNYEGVLPSEEHTFMQYALGSLDVDMDNPAIIMTSGSAYMKVKESDINTIILTKSLVGTTVTFYNLKNDGTYDVSIITLEAFNMDIKDNETTLSFVISINGYKTIMKIKCAGEPQTGTSLTLNITNMHVGSKVASNDLVKAFLTKVNEAVSGDNWLSCNVEEKTITFSFDSIVKEKQVLKTIMNLSGTQTKSSLKDNNDGDGFVQLEIKWFND
ncbi:MAG: hypothetical protein K5765_07565 [Clostridia bacterium]|nr:hypothetical protein [Clostridia bacterium]